MGLWFIVSCLVACTEYAEVWNVGSVWQNHANLIHTLTFCVFIAIWLAFKPLPHRPSDKW
jgi:hypothetical protein